MSGHRNPETEAALAVIRAEEQHPHRPDCEPVRDNAPGLLRALERMVEDKLGGAA